MEIKTFRAASMQEALQRVREELGPDAAVLQTREVRRTGMLGLLSRGREIEVTASQGVNVPSRLPQAAAGEDIAAPRAASQGSESVIAHAPEPRPSSPFQIGPAQGVGPAQGSTAAESDFGSGITSASPPRQASGFPAQDSQRGEKARASRPLHLEYDYRAKFREDVKGQRTNWQSMVEELCRPEARAHRQNLPEALFRVFTDMIEADVDEDAARELLEQVRNNLGPDQLTDPIMIKARIARLLEEQIAVCGPVHAEPGSRRLVALVGPTGVGKTTTIAKLAANYRLREKLRVGLITVDTYRIAAVEQLRTYADIIDLPMEVVSTPREMREAVARMADLDLVLMDTAGRSPRDEVRIQELKSMLAEANADEVHLVLSSIVGSSNLVATAQRFAEAGTTALVLTKLDEATGLGNLLPLLRRVRLPLSYLTNGQNVPDDIAVADRRWLANNILGMESDR